MPRPKVARERLAARACDSCKVRKIRCTEVAPCAACKKSGIECTFRATQAQRGPRGLRPVTIQRIQGHPESPSKSRKEKSSTCKETDQVRQLASLIDIYASRLFPVWPILDTEKLRQSLQAKPRHAGPWRLATAVGLATVAQLKLDTTWQADPEQIRRNGSPTAEATDPLDDLRISFFLHVHHENSTPGGRESLLCLREAITLAQMLRLEHEGMYTSFSNADEPIYRRTLWLLFVTERGVALLHKLPTILKPNILFPWHCTSNNEASQVLPAFLRLVQLFWIFDQSGIIDMLQNAEHNTTHPYSHPHASNCLELLQPKLQQLVTDNDWGYGTDVQRADVLLTQQWMRAILWRAALRFGVSGLAVEPADPVDIARDFLSLTAQVPPAALESHGATLEFKTFEIATTVVDSIASNYCLAFPIDYVAATLISLRNMLSSFRGGNGKLLSLLESKMQFILGFGAPARTPSYNNQDQAVAAETRDEERQHNRGTQSLGTELLMALSVRNTSEDGTPFPWADPDLMALLDFPFRIADTRLESGILEAAADVSNSNRWVVNEEPSEENAVGQ